jgi:two-component system, response regulator PdtaR
MTENQEAKRPAILIVEDEALSRVMSANVLEKAGFTVIEAANAEDALRLLETRYDVQILFTDIQMPGRFNGLALARAVHRRWPYIKLLITSGREKPRKEEIPDDSRFISKPFLPRELIGAINNLIEKF